MSLHNPPVDRALARMSMAGRAWFAVAVLGQGAFVAFIAAYYGRRTLRGDFGAWNDKPLIDGYIAGDPAGNVMFIAHVLLAAVVTSGGLLQLSAALRARWPAVHRWNGRVYLAICAFLAVGGLWLTWGRGTHLSIVSAVAISIDAVLILLFGGCALVLARRRNFDAHRRYALRTFVVVSGVWFLRVGLMAWVIINQGPRGMNTTLSGPADVALVFGSYLVPLLVLELTFLARRRGRLFAVRLATACLALGTLVTAIGIFGTVAMMWWPYL